MKLTIALSMVIIFAMLVGDALAGPRSVIVNYCPFTVYVWSVSEDHNPDSHIPDNRIEQNQQYIHDWYQPSQGGISHKLNRVPHLDHPHQLPISQFEVCQNGAKQWYYDFSNVNCMNIDPASCPFAYHGVLVKTSDPTCNTARCAPGDLYCTGAYLFDKDDTKTKGCNDGSGDAILVLCEEFAP